MNTIGWLLILAAGVLIRQIKQGRVMNLGEDLSDMFIAIASGDSKGLSAVLARTGEGLTASDDYHGTLTYYGKGNPANAATTNTPANNVVILREAINLGEKAKGYRFVATGPDYYDCSGLMWRACQKAGYGGPRFTTATIKLMKGFTQVGNPALGVSTSTIGDLVVWPGHHMGVVSKSGQFYSARSVRSGIGEAQIQNFSGYGTPIYLRYTG